MRGGLALGAALCAAFLSAAPQPAHAHLLADGHGTLNVQGGAVFVALSIPVVWLGAVDDDRDGLLSAAELQVHRASILRVLAGGITVDNGGAARALQDMLLSPSAAHDRSDGAGSHLLVMGYAPLADPAGPTRLSLGLAGPAATLTVTATRDPLREQAVLQGPRDARLFFASAWARAWDGALQWLRRLWD